jgi:chemotaxis protein methyltransferase CheR
MSVDIEKIEINLLLEGIYQRYGYDFRKYAGAHVKRRVKHLFATSGFASISAMQQQILYDGEYFAALLEKLTINVTEMFRDPRFFLALRNEIVPLLKTYPFMKIWHAGCATGEEVYSMAILLEEEGGLERSQIYATDMSESALKSAKEGIVAPGEIQKYTRNYQKAGGKRSFGDYFSARYDAAILNRNLKERIVFANHNLVTDGSFGEMQMIVCRNVLIYFNTELQDKVIKLFYESLSPGGILCLGAKESLRGSSYSSCFEPLLKKEKIFQKKYQ